MLFSFKRKTYHTFFLILSFFGILIATISLLLIISFLQGAQKKIERNYFKNEPHILIEPKFGSFLEDNKEFFKKLMEIDGILKVEKILKIEGFSPNFKGNILGKDTVEENIIPFGTIGEVYEFSISEIYLTPFGPDLKKIKIKKEKEGKDFQVPLKILQEMTNKENKISFYEVYIRNINKIKEIQENIKKVLPNVLKSETIFEKKRAIFFALKLEKFSMVLSVFLILLVSLFQLYFSLKLLIFHYKSTWAIFKVLGLPHKKMFQIFSFFCFYIFSFSSILGFFLSFIIIKLQNKYQIFPFPSELIHLSFINYLVPYKEFLSLFLLLCFISIFFGWVLGKEVKKISPQEVLRVPQ